MKSKILKHTKFSNLIFIVIAVALVFLAIFSFSACNKQNDITPTEKKWDKIDVGVATSSLELVEPGTLTVAVDPTTPAKQFQRRNDQGEIIGFDVDLINCICDSLGLKPKLVEVPIKDIRDELQNSNKYDIGICAFSYKPEDMKNFRVSDAYLDWDVLMVKPKNSPLTWKEVKEKAGKEDMKIYVDCSYRVFSNIIGVLPDNTYEVLNTAQDCVDHLNKGDYDCFLTSKANIGRLEGVNKDKYSESVYIGNASKIITLMPKKNQNLYKAVNAIFDFRWDDLQLRKSSQEFFFEYVEETAI